MKKRILSLLLVVCMVMSLVPMTAFAVDSCVDENGDYICDHCDSTMLHACVDEDGDTACDICGIEGVHSCVDADNNYNCDVCGFIFGHNCVDANGDTLCDYCYKDVHDCVDADGDFRCDLCQYPLEHECAEHDADGDWWCDVCTFRIPHDCVDADGNWRCDKCGLRLCDPCVDADGDYHCDQCGYVFSHSCIDETCDHWCDKCGESMYWFCEDPNCPNEDGDYWCDVHDYLIPHDGVDDNHDYYCDLCHNMFQHYCMDENGDWWCDKCSNCLCAPCIDENADCWCDQCGGLLRHDCIDENRDHDCDLCGLYNAAYCDDLDCADENGDNICDTHGWYRIHEGVDADNDWYCDLCNECFVHVCVDENEDWRCDKCEQATAHDCIDENRDHYCDLCGYCDFVACDCAPVDGVYYCYEHWSWIRHDGVDENNDWICDLCFEGFYHECVDEDSNSWCDLCGGWISHFCEDVDGDSLCDLCGMCMSDCTDENRDHYCDLCGYLQFQGCNCEPVDGVYYCQRHNGRIPHRGVDANNDWVCDLCYYTFPHECVDTNGDVHCDLCYGLFEHECESNDGDANCDWCHVTMEHDHVDVNNDFECDLCGETVDHECFSDDGNIWCDICGSWMEHECADADGNFLCDLYGCVQTHTCEDRDGDYLCDVCKDIVEHDCEDHDRDEDYRCDLCWSLIQHTHKDKSPKDYYCDLCGLPVAHTCKDTDANFVCDICYELIEHTHVDDDGDYNCDYCWYTFDHRCEFSRDWQFDQQDHYHECPCGSRVDRAKHAGTGGTCLQLPVCNVCQEEYGELRDFCTDEDGNGLCDLCGLVINGYELWVGGIQVGAGNQDDILGDGTVSYNPETQTLTLTNATITGAPLEGDEDYNVGIHGNGQLTVVLNGSNTVTADGAEQISVAVAAEYLTITGSGSLYAAGSSANTSAGLFGFSVQINGGNITAYGQLAGVMAYDYVSFQGGNTAASAETGMAVFATAPFFLADDLEVLYGASEKADDGYYILQTTENPVIIGEAPEAVMVNLEDCVISYQADVVYTGKYIRPELYITAPDGRVLVMGEDFTASYKNNKYPGTATITVTGKNMVTGKLTLRFGIYPRVAEDVWVTDVKKHSISIAWDGVSEANRYYIYVDGEYWDSTTKRSYTISGLDQGQEFEIVVAAGTKDGLYRNPSEPIFQRAYADLEDCDITLEYKETIYDGTPKTPVISIEDYEGVVLTAGEHFQVRWENNTDVGIATATITGFGYFGGEETVTFKILPGQVTGLTVTPTGEGGSVNIAFDEVPGAQEYWIYRGSSRKAKITDTSYTMTGLTAGSTYSFSVKAVAEVDGDDYIGKASATVKCKPVYFMDDFTLTVNDETMTYTGKARKPSVTVRTDTGKKLSSKYYTVSCENNKDIGTATVTVTGKGKYEGEFSEIFYIVPGRPGTPDVSYIDGVSAEVDIRTVKGAQWYDVYVDGVYWLRTYEDECIIEGLQAGVSQKITVAAGATVGGKEYIGQVSKYDSVTPRHKMAQQTVELSQERFVYTGKYQRPTVTVYGYEGTVLTEGVDYTLKFTGNKNTGKATITVTGKGSYTGTAKAYYYIDPEVVEDLRVSSTTNTSVKIKFDKSSSNSAKYYEIYVDGVKVGRTTGSSYTIKGLDQDKEYKVYVVATKTVSGIEYRSAPCEEIGFWFYGYNSTRRAAYEQALTDLRTNRCLPDVPVLDFDDYYSMSDNRFAVCDIDEDGADELIIEYTTACVAGHLGVIYEYDNGEFHEQLREYPYFKPYTEGVLWVGASHNQSPSYKVWPYSLYFWDPATDTYTSNISVDAWTKADWPIYYGEAFPDDIDTDGAGTVYNITEDGVTRTVCKTDYEAWLADTLGSAKTKSISWKSLTAKNIKAVS